MFSLFFSLLLYVFSICFIFSVCLYVSKVVSISLPICSIFSTDFPFFSSFSLFCLYYLDFCLICAIVSISLFLCPREFFYWSLFRLFPLSSNFGFSILSIFPIRSILIYFIILRLLGRKLFRPTKSPDGRRR